MEKVFDVLYVKPFHLNLGAYIFLVIQITSTKNMLTLNAKISIQLWTYAYVQLLDRHYENEVTLREQY